MLKEELIKFASCICLAASFANALNVLHLEPSCQIGFVHLSFFFFYCTKSRKGIVNGNEPFLHYTINHLALTILPLRYFAFAIVGKEAKMCMPLNGFQPSRGITSD